MWQNATYTVAMAQSVRISDAAYEMAAHEAKLMDRSLAQQLEHWIKLGAAVERSGDAGLRQIREAALQLSRLRDAAAVRTGLKRAEDLYAFSAAEVHAAKVRMPKNAFSEFDG